MRGMSGSAGNILHICPRYGEQGELTASPRRRETSPVLASSSTVSTCQEDGVFWLNPSSQGPHPDPGETPVPSDVAAHGGWGTATVSCLQREDPQQHPFIYVFAVMSDQPAWLFPRQGEGESRYFAHVQMLVLPLKSPDELVLCNAGLKFVRGAAII